MSLINGGFGSSGNRRDGPCNVARAVNGEGRHCREVTVCTTIATLRHIAIHPVLVGHRVVALRGVPHLVISKGLVHPTAVTSIH